MNEAKMWRKLTLIMVFLVVAISTTSGQEVNKSDCRTLMIELGNMLKQLPETKEESQALLKQIKAWQEKKLNELAAPKAKLRITAPVDKAQVPERPLVEGRVADPNAKVWVIVHPMEVSDYWIQPSVSVNKNGAWQVIIYIGRPGSIDVGKHFEIMAFANPKVKLSEGTILGGWPEAQWKSEVITVTRK